jgi:hypothetical protein
VCFFKLLMKSSAGSEVWLELELESAFPVDLLFDDIAISLAHGPLTAAAAATTAEARCRYYKTFFFDVIYASFAVLP